MHYKKRNEIATSYVLNLFSYFSVLSFDEESSQPFCEFCGFGQFRGSFGCISFQSHLCINCVPSLFNWHDCKQDMFLFFNDSEFCFYKSQLLKEGTLKVSFKSNCLSSSLFLFPSYLNTHTQTLTYTHTHTHTETYSHKNTHTDTDKHTHTQTHRHARMHAESEKKTCCFSQRHNLSKFNGRELFV